MVFIVPNDCETFILGTLRVGEANWPREIVYLGQHKFIGKESNEDNDTLSMVKLPNFVGNYEKCIRNNNYKYRSQSCIHIYDAVTLVFIDMPLVCSMQGEST